MIRRTHIVTTQTITLGLGMALGAMNHADPAQMITGMLPVLVGSHYGAQFPDIDQANTDINRNLGFVGKWCLKHFKHRYQTHTLWALMIYYGLWFATTWCFHGAWTLLVGPLLFGFAWGNTWHLIEDNFSRAGVAFLWPWRGGYEQNKTNAGFHKIRKHGYTQWRYKVGGPFETFLYYVLSTVLIVLYISFFWKYIGHIEVLH